jgi:nitrogen fixation protein FixH
VTLSATDTGGSGVDKTYYTTDGSAPTTASSVYNAGSKPVLTSDGQTIKYFSTDKAGNEETARSATAHIARSAPITSDDVPAAFVNHNVTVTLSASDTGGSGVNKTYYTTDGSTPTTASSVYNAGSKPVLASDGQTIKYFSTDNAGNEETAHSATAHIDRAAPTTTDNVPSAYVNHDVTVTLSASDTGGSGVDKTYYTTDGSAPTTASSLYNAGSKPVLTTDGQVIKYFSTDKAGNEESVHSATAHIARSAPITSDDVPAAFVNHNVTVTLSATDTGGSGVNKTYYTTDGSTPTTTSSVYNAASKPVLTSDGQIIKYFSTDSAGNEESVHSATAHIDRAAPTTTDNVPSAYVNHDVTVTLSASDTGGSGLEKTYYTTDGSAPSTSSLVYNSSSKPVLTSDGQTIKYFSTDNAGNSESTHSATAHIDRSAPTTTDNVPSGQATSSITVTLTASDAGGSGVNKTYYTTDGSTPTTASSVYNPASKPVLTNDGQVIKYFSTDNAGNSETPHSATAHIQSDGIAPTTTDNVDANWHVSPVSVTLTATDNVGGSGVKATSFKVYSGSTVPATSDSGWQTYNPAAKPMLNNGQAIAYYSTDNAGNQESVKHSVAAKVDAVSGVTAGATYTLGSVPAAVCVDTSAIVSYSGKVGSVTATCTDGGGAVGVTYTVAYCATNLTSPVSGSWVTSTGTCTTPAPSTAVYNTAKAGSSVPLKFSLHGNQGLGIFATGYPLSQQVLATGSFTDNTVTATAGESGLSYDPGSDQYTYVWKTSKDWSGQNRQLVLALNDGVTYIRANFYLK